MRKIMMVLMAGTAISASAMAGISTVNGDKKVANTVEEAKNEIIDVATNEVASIEASSTTVIYTTGDEQDSTLVDKKLADMFVIADLDADGFLTEVEYIDYQTAKARSQFASMAGDDALVSIEEVKYWYLSQKPEKPTTSSSEGASE